MKRLADCKDCTARNTKKFKKDDEPCRAVVRGGMGKMEGCGTLYEKDVTDVFKSRLNSAEKMIPYFVPRRETFTRSHFPIYDYGVYLNMILESKEGSDGSQVSGKVWIEITDGNTESFMRLVKLISQKNWRRYW